MNKTELENLIRDLVERLTVPVENITTSEDRGGTFVALEVREPHFFISREGEALHALNHLVHRMIEARADDRSTEREPGAPGVIVDVNGFQKKRIEGIRAVAHMMSERARYFKSNIEIDPMSAFERRIVHEFLADAHDLETESIGAGRSRRVVIKYKGSN